MALKLPSETEKTMVASIKAYFRENLEDEIGDMKAGLVLDFFLKELAPTIYNKAIGDAKAYLLNTVTDLDGSCFEAEFTYWDKRK
jgi:uncharacterized protein (DUF2164 family)